MDCVIGCDIGSQSTKAVLLTLEGAVLGEAAHDYAIDHPRPLWAEQPVERWTDALAVAVRRVLARCGVAPRQVRAISLACQVDGLVPVDTAGQALRPAIIWMDRRADGACRQARQAASAAHVLNLTGLNLDPSHVAPKIAWLAEHEPEVFARAAAFFMPGTYMAHYLSGEVALDYSNASSTLLLDIRQREWSDEMCALFGVPPARLARLASATLPLGKLRPEAAQALGLTTSTRVILGSGDEHAACLGAGVLEPGLVGDIAGTAEPVCAASAQPLFDPEGLVETHCHAQPGVWLLENPGFVSGANYRWLRDNFAPDERRAAAQGGPSAYAQLDALAASAPPGCQGLVLLPCLMGAMTPTWNENARGTFFGFTLAHGRAHFARAVLEGSAFGVRDITDRMQAMGLAPTELRVMGGGAVSPLWNQIKADVTGLPVAVPETTETTGLGAALLALAGIGACANLAEACALVVRIQQRFEPDPSRRAVYEDAYGLYRQVYFDLLPAFERAAGATTQPH